MRASFTGAWATTWSAAQASASRFAQDLAGRRRTLTALYAKLVAGLQFLAAARQQAEALPSERHAAVERDVGPLVDEGRRYAAMMLADVPAEGVGAVPLVPIVVIGAVGLAVLYLLQPAIDAWYVQSQAVLERVKVERAEMEARDVASREGRALQPATLPPPPEPPPALSFPTPSAGALVAGLVVVDGLVAAGAVVARGRATR